MARSRSGSTRPTVNRTKTFTASAIDQVASEALIITDVKGKKRHVESNLNPAATKLTSMRAVNTASQSLSNLVQSGWKKSMSTFSGSSKVPLETARSAASDAMKHLGILRQMSPGDIDVERAAMSVLGKLMALEVYDLAATATEAMHPRICQLINGSNESSYIKETNYFSIPRSSSTPTDCVLLNLLSTYLLYALVVASRQETSGPDSIKELSTALHLSSTHSLLSWMSIFSSLPARHLNSLLTQAYTSLTKFCSSTTAPRKTLPKSKPTTTLPPPEALFHLRTYALRCLAHTSPGIVDANTFWDQVMKFASSFIRATTASSMSEEHATSVILASFAEIIKVAEIRKDKESFLAVDGDEGRKFVEFCDFWTSFAKRAGNISLLQKINILMHKPSELVSSPVKWSSQHPNTPESHRPGEKQTLMVEGTKLCNQFAQLSVLLEELFKANERRLYEQENDSLLPLIHSCRTTLESPQIGHYFKYTTSNSTQSDGDEFERVCAKVKRAVEKVRRLSIKALELFEPSSGAMEAVYEGLSTLLHALIGSFQWILSEETLTQLAICDLLTPVLDTLFILARLKLRINDPSTFVPSFEFLSQASQLLDSINISSKISPSDLDIANFTRCLSGAFYNIAGTLYQAVRYGNAVPFLLESCLVGNKALDLRRSPHQRKAGETESREKDWKQLEDQLYRRWELLGVCYSKNGDRKKAFEAYQRAISAFPFASSGLVERINTLPPDAALGEDSSTSLKQLVALIDRTTYLGACELFLPPDQISLRSTITYHEHNFSVAGALLERQLTSLGSSQWKEGTRTVLLHLLKDAVEVYSGAEAAGPSSTMPIRKARILVRYLEFAYRDSTPAVESVMTFKFKDVEGVAGKVEQLCTMQALGKDISLAHFGLQYRIAAHLWVALHAHRRSDPDQNTIMTQRSEEACRLLKIVLGEESVANQSSKVIPSPRVVIRKTVGSPKVARIVSPKTTRVTRRVAPPAPKKAVQVKKVKTKVVEDPVTPKPKTKRGVRPATHTSPRPSVEGKPTTPPTTSFENFEGFMNLLQHISRILGLLSLILAKAHVLDMARKLAQQHLGIKSDEYIISSLDLAHEYITLGKLKRAAAIFNSAREVVQNREASPDISVRFLLRFSESLALFEDIPTSAVVYLEALQLSKEVEVEGLTTWQRICAKAKVLEIAATASHTFATIQFAKGNTGTSLEASLQALRLWNRATDVMLRLHPSASTISESNPFEMSALKDALPVIGSGLTDLDRAKQSPRLNTGRPTMNELHWRISEGLLSTIFSLTEIYFLKGSPREASYFVRQAAELAEQLNAPAMTSRAYAKLGEIQLHMGRLQDSHVSLTTASDLLQDMPGLDAADVRRLRVEYNTKVVAGDDPTESFKETIRMMEELDCAFHQFDRRAFGPRRSLESSPRPTVQSDVLAPTLLSAILSQQLWLLRNDAGDQFDAVLDKFLSLSYTTATKAAENALLAKLTLHSIYGRFQGDMFLSSLMESTIAAPMCMRSKDDRKPMATATDIIEALSKAENLLSAYLNTSATRASVIEVREAAISLVLVYAFRTSLGDRRPSLPSVMAKLLDASSGLTLCRDMLEAIDQKFVPNSDDLQWPSLSQGGDALPRSPQSTTRRRPPTSLSDSDSEEEDSSLSFHLIKEFWMQVQARYRSLLKNPSGDSSSEIADLPDNWTVINISLAPDKNTLFCCRREGGESSLHPLIFCIPLKGRREQGSGNDYEEHLTLDGAMEELQDIIRHSDESTKAAITIRADDEEARSNWWTQRRQLDARLRELLENIEFCWLGAFKTILGPRLSISPALISDIREQLQRIFLQYLHMKGKKVANLGHKRTTSQARPPNPSQLKLDDKFIRAFCTLSPKCRDEELEDLVYFILDLYQHHGVPVAISEVDIDQTVLDLRTLLEEHAAKQLKSKKASEVPSDLDEHVFLVLDKNLQGIPWESLPILRGRSVSRIPGIQFLHDRIAFAKRKREAMGQPFDSKLGALIDSRKGYFILNPSGDLGRTEERFRNWASNMKAYGWSGTVGRSVSELEFVDALKTKDLVIYFGHGGGEQYIRSQRIRSLPNCAATMLWGCSSGALRELGDFDRAGTPYNYMLAGCPTLVANLWDVTDKDIDKVCQSVFDKLSLNGNEDSGKKNGHVVSVVAAVAQSRNSCKLKYLTGAAPVVYGIPFYI